MITKLNRSLMFMFMSVLTGLTLMAAPAAASSTASPDPAVPEDSVSISPSSEERR